MPFLPPNQQRQCTEGEVHTVGNILGRLICFIKKVKAAHNNEEVATVKVTTGHMAAA